MNVARLVIEYGDIAAMGVVAFCAATVLFTLRRGGRWFPRGVVAWAVCLLALAVAGLGLSFFGFVTQKAQPLRRVLANAHRPAPDFAFVDVPSGRARTLREFRGKVVVLNFWATWCPPCRREMPELERLQQEYGRDGVVVITVSDESAESLERFPDFTALHVVKGRVDPATDAPGFYVDAHVARPITHVIDRAGVLRETLVGGADFATFEARVKPLLGS